MKQKRIVSPKLQRSARGQPCTVNVIGVCSYDSETTVLAHIQTDGGKMGGKADDLSACYACYQCHQWLDQYMGTEEERLFYQLRALTRTHRIMHDQGLIKI